MGYAFEYLHKIRPDIKIIIIQIKETVNGKIKVYSNTKQLLKLHLLLIKMGYNGITQLFSLGGGKISQQEVDLIKKLNLYEDKTNKKNYINYTKYNLESRY